MMIWFAKLMKFLSQIIIQFRVKFLFGCILFTKKAIKKYRNLNQLTDQKLLNFLFLLYENLKKKSTESIDGKIQFSVSTNMQALSRYAPVIPEKISHN